MTAKSKRRIHMVGIAGAGMSNIAIVLAEQGHRVSGSDLQCNRTTRKLEEMGIEFYQGHSSSNLKEGVDLLVVSSAVPPDNSEVRLARERNVPVWKRGQMLAHIVNDGKAIAVAGAHGKTTTTAMLYTALRGCSLDPTFILGGEMQGNGLGARLGTAEYSIVEADESDASFLALKPYIAVVTNIENDHLDYYKSLENIRKAFELFIKEVKPEGFALLYAGGGGAAGVETHARGRTLSYGERSDCDYCLRDWQAVGTGSQFTVYHRGTRLGRALLSIPGKHNSLNALAALAVANEMGLDFDKAAGALQGFKGAKRRFELIGQVGNVRIVDDYAHHPTEIKATIAAARNYHHEGRILVVFQPHRFSRTEILGRQLGEALADVDKVVVTDIYTAGEKPIDGITGRAVYEAAINAGCDAEYLSSLEEIEEFILGFVQSHDLIITMGAGDIWRVGVDLTRKLPEVIPQA